MKKLKYYCKGCDKIIYRDKYFKTTVSEISFCATLGKKLKLELVNDGVAQLYYLLKKQSKH